MQDGSINEFENTYSLLSPLICEAIATKEDRRTRKMTPAHSSSYMVKTATGSDNNNSNSNTSSNNGSGHNAMVATSNSMDGGEVAASTVTVIHDDNASGSQYLKLGGHLGEVFMCLWSPASNQLSSGSADGTCRLW